VVPQMSAGDGFDCGADVGWGRTLSRCKGGQGIDSVQFVQMWAGGGLGPGADVGPLSLSLHLSTRLVPAVSTGNSTNEEGS
jgi:hypothetical protein